MDFALDGPLVTLQRGYGVIVMSLRISFYHEISSKMLQMSLSLSSLQQVRIFVPGRKKIYNHGGERNLIFL